MELYRTFGTDPRTVSPAGTTTLLAMRTAIIVLSDPSHDSEESLGRVFNALAAAHELKAKGHDVKLQFQGAGTRWPERLVKPDHPAHALYIDLEGALAGASCGCAEVFGAKESCAAAGVPLLKDYALPGTNGIGSIVEFAEQGYSVITF